MAALAVEAHRGGKPSAYNRTADYILISAGGHFSRHAAFVAAIARVFHVIAALMELSTSTPAERVAAGVARRLGVSSNMGAVIAGVQAPYPVGD